MPSGPACSSRATTATQSVPPVMSTQVSTRWPVLSKSAWVRWNHRLIPAQATAHTR